MQKNFYSLITAVAALCAVSCDAITGCPADEANSYAKAIELTRKSVDSERFKIYSISFMEMSELSNDLGLVTVKMVNKDDSRDWSPRTCAKCRACSNRRNMRPP